MAKIEKEEEKNEQIDLKIVGMSKNDILAQVSQEVKISTDFVSSRRQQFRDRLALYNNQRKQKDKIGILTLYTTINTLLAVSYTDEMTVEFTARKFANSQFAQNANSVAEFDHEEMNLAEVNYYTQWDKYFYGVGLRDISTFNTTTNTPIVKTLSPLCWLPDPATGSNFKQGYTGRFYGFEVERSKEEMEEENGFFNVESISISKPNSEQQATKSAEQEAHGVNPSDDGSLKNNTIYQIDWFTHLKNENGGVSKYLLTVSADCKELFRIEKIEPVTLEEKKDESLVPWPLVVNYYSPQRNNPFGVSVGDLVEDKQRAKSVLANLRIGKEKAALYPMYLYNTRAIRNRRDLDFGFNKAIGANLKENERLSDVLMPIAKDGNTNSTFAQEQSLDAENNLATGADSMRAGVMSSQSNTATEVQQVTMNAQTRFLLGYRINIWGEKHFWRLWYRLYRQFFSQTQEKIVRLQNGFGIRYTKITRKDFITVEDPDISIISKTELRSRKDKERMAFSQIVPLLLQDPKKPDASKNYAMRYLLKLNDLANEVIEILVPDSPGEQRAKIENELLSRNISAELMLDDDHLSHMIIHSAAEDSEAKFAHIEAHRQAYILSGQQEKAAQMAMQAMAGSQNQGNMAINSIQNQAANMFNNSRPQPLEANV
jgi:hypothetical protein